MIMRNDNNPIHGEETRGVLYVAFGDRWIREVQLSAKSLKKAYPDIPVALISDKHIDSELFDQVMLLSSFKSDGTKKSGFTYKILALRETPFDKTVFIDTDTYVKEQFSELYALLDYFDLLGCLDIAGNRFPIIGNQRLEGCYLFNSGVMAYKRNEKIIDLFDRWEHAYLDNYDAYHGDMDALTQAIVETEIRLYPLPNIYNFIVYDINVVPPAKVKILHGRPYEKLVEVAAKVNRYKTQKVYIPDENTITLNIGKGSILKKYPLLYRVSKVLYDSLPAGMQKRLNKRKA